MVGDWEVLSVTGLDKRRSMMLTVWASWSTVKECGEVDEGESMAAEFLTLAASSVEGDEGMMCRFDGLGDGSGAEGIGIEASKSSKGGNVGTMMRVQGDEVGWKEKAKDAECAKVEGETIESSPSESEVTFGGSERFMELATRLLLL